MADQLQPNSGIPIVKREDSARDMSVRHCRNNGVKVVPLLFLQEDKMPHNRIRTFNKHITNPLLHRFASCSRGPFAVIRHVGRRSGKPYETTIMFWPMGDGFVIAL